MSIFPVATKRGAYATYLTMCAVSSFCNAAITTVNMIYQATTVGLSPLQLVLVGTTLEVTAFVCQIPTGILADAYSRRLAVIIGYSLYGLGFVLESLVPQFAVILLGQVIWGLGISFIMGAEEAWLSDELGEDKAAEAFLRSTPIASIAGLLGIGLSVLLGSIKISLPILVGGVGLMVLAVYLLIAMPETGFRHKATVAGEGRVLIRQFAETLRLGGKLLRLRPILLTIAAIGLFYGLYSEGYDRLWTDHVLTNFQIPVIDGWQPVVWFGFMRAAALLFSALATDVLRRRIKTDRPGAALRALLWISIVQVLSLIAFGLAGDFSLAVAAFMLFNTMRTVSGPIWTGWINRQMDSSIRATMHSFFGQIDAFGQIGGGPVVGALAQTLSALIGLGAALRATMVLVGVVLSPVVGLYVRALRQESRSGQADHDLAATIPIAHREVQTSE